MARVTSSQVQAVLGNNYDGSKDLSAYIATATILTDRTVLCAANKSVTIDSDTAAQLETYLAAHFYTLHDPTYSSRSTQGASGSFHGQTGKGLESSMYGQTAILMDPSGCLNSFDKRQKASMIWLGTDLEDA